MAERPDKIPLKEAVKLANQGTIKERLKEQKKRLKKKYPNIKFSKWW